MVSRTARSLIVLAIVTLVFAACVPVQPEQPAAEPEAAPSSNVIEATFVCPDGTELPTVFDNNTRTATVGLPDGEVTLPLAVSASGARYANDDESIVFWNKGDTALVELNGEIVYQECVAEDAPWMQSPSANVIEATFVCPDGTELPTVFDNDAGTVTVTLPDGEVTLPRAESASGARYANEDESIVFWNQGDEAMVEIDGEMVYQGCLQQDAGADAATAPSNNVIEATFVCPDGTELPATFDNDAQTVTVGLPDGEVTLPQTVSGSGARYANEDESIVFWNQGDEAMVQVDGETVYEGCVAQ